MSKKLKISENAAVNELSSETATNTVLLSLLLSEKQTTDFLGVSLSFLRKARSEGAPGKRTQAPPFIKIGKRCFYRRSDLEDWVKSLLSQRVL